MSLRNRSGPWVPPLTLFPTTSRRALIRDTMAAYAPNAPGAVAGPEVGQGSSSSVSVMVVDDSVLMVKKLETMLAKLGHRVIRSVNTGAAAVYAFGECMPDLVTMDITMPDMDGIEASRRILQAFPQARIVMVTSHGQESMVRDAIQAGVFGYVFKPVLPEKLAEHIRRALRR